MLYCLVVEAGELTVTKWRKGWQPPFWYFLLMRVVRGRKIVVERWWRRRDGGKGGERGGSHLFGIFF